MRPPAPLVHDSRGFFILVAAVAGCAGATKKPAGVIVKAWPRDLVNHTDCAVVPLMRPLIGSACERIMPAGVAQARTLGHEQEKVAARQRMPSLPGYRLCCGRGAYKDGPLFA